jgi:hypothetical protein
MVSVAIIFPERNPKVPETRWHFFRVSGFPIMLDMITSKQGHHYLEVVKSSLSVFCALLVEYSPENTYKFVIQRKMK